MKTILQSLLLMWSVLLTRSAAGQAPDQPAPKSCGTPAIETLLAAHPEMRARVAAIEAQTQRYIKEAGLEVNRLLPGPAVPLLVIPVVVHVIYGAADQNLSDAVIQNQIEELNLAFRGALSPGPNANPSVVPLPPAFASLVGDARVQFCLATRTPSGTPTTGITRRNNIGTQYAGGFGFNDQMKRTSTGGTDAWNTAHYLNIWCCDLEPGLYGFGVFPGTATYPGEDGIAMNYAAFGWGHAALDPSYALGRVAVHEVGHWLRTCVTSGATPAAAPTT